MTDTKQFYTLTRVSSNVKTGPIPVSTTSADSCPPSCGQFSTCYAKYGPVKMHWDKVASKGMELDAFCDAIKALPPGTLWRHNQAGDLPGFGETLDVSALIALGKANDGRKGFTYTHKVKGYAQALKASNSAGFVVNASADTLAQADSYRRVGLPTVVVCHEKQTTNFKTPMGNLVVICPAVTGKTANCSTCRLCAWGEREVIIGFPAHGTKKKAVKADLVQIGKGE